MRKSLVAIVGVTLVIGVIVSFGMSRISQAIEAYSAHSATSDYATTAGVATNTGDFELM